MRLDELLENLENDKEVLGVIKDFENSTGETIILEMEEFENWICQIRLIANCPGIEKELIDLWEFFDFEEFKNYMREISDERYKDIVWEITEYVKDLKERMGD